MTKNPASSEEGSRGPGKAAEGQCRRPPRQAGKPLRPQGEREGSRRECDYEKTTQPYILTAARAGKTPALDCRGRGGHHSKPPEGLCSPSQGGLLKTQGPHGPGTGRGPLPKQLRRLAFPPPAGFPVGNSGRNCFLPSASKERNCVSQKLNFLVLLHRMKAVLPCKHPASAWASPCDIYLREAETQAHSPFPYFLLPFFSAQGMSQVSQQVFMERPQDCRAWEETGLLEAAQESSHSRQ